MTLKVKEKYEQRNHPDAPEQRTVDVGVESMEVRGNTVTGYAAVYGVESNELRDADNRPFRERIAPGAFDGVLNSNSLDVRMLLNHNDDAVLGRTKSGTLRLSTDQRGLKFECDLPESRTDLREAVKRGDIDGASFRFRVGEESWEGETRTVNSVKELKDVTLATYPAYPATSVELRTRTDDRQPVNRPSDGLVVRDRLRVEDRNEGSGSNQSELESRVAQAIRSIPRGGTAVLGEERRGLTTADATAITPPELSSFLFESLRPSSVALLSGVLTIPTEKAQMIWPKLTTAVTPTWIHSGEEIPQGDPTITSLKVVPKKLAHLIKVENEVVDDSEPSVIDVLNNHLALMLALQLDFTVFEGDNDANADEPNGMANTEGIQHGKKPTKYDPFIEAVGKLRDANAPGPYVAVGPPSVGTALELLKDKNENYLTPPKEMPTFYPSTQLTNTFVYAPSQVVITPRQDATIEVDRSRYFETDETAMRGKLRADILLPNPEAIVLMDES